MNWWTDQQIDRWAEKQINWSFDTDSRGVVSAYLKSMNIKSQYNECLLPFLSVEANVNAAKKATTIIAEIVDIFRNISFNFGAKSFGEVSLTAIEQM